MELFSRIGRKSTRLIRAAAMKLSQEVHALLNRPRYAVVTRCLERLLTDSSTCLKNLKCVAPPYPHC